MREVKNLLGQFFPNHKVDVNIKIHKVSYTKDDYGIGCMLIGDGCVWDCGTVGERVQEAEILERIRHYAQ